MPAPHEHLAIAYLLYSAYTRLRHGRPPRTDAVFVLLVASQLPDLIDKPLAWWLGALPEGHTLAHSLLFAVPLVAIVWLDGRLFGADWAGPAVAVGYLSHVLADAALYVALAGRSQGTFLLWPAYPARLTVEPEGVTLLFTVAEWYVSLFRGPYGDVILAVEIVLFAATMLAWHRDGYPGVGALAARAPTLR